MKIKKIIGSILFAVGLVALWQLLYVAATDWFDWAKPYAVPHPLGVWKSICSLMADGTLLSAVASSMLRVLTGFVISIVIGIVLAS